MWVVIKILENGKSIFVKVNGSDTVKDLKFKIQKKKGFPPELQKLFCNLCLLDDKVRMDECKLSLESTTHFILTQRKEKEKNEEVKDGELDIHVAVLISNRVVHIYFEKNEENKVFNVKEKFSRLIKGDIANCTCWISRKNEEEGEWVECQLSDDTKLISILEELNRQYLVLKGDFVFSSMENDSIDKCEIDNVCKEIGKVLNKPVIISYENLKNEYENEGNDYDIKEKFQYLIGYVNDLKTKNGLTYSFQGFNLENINIGKEIGRGRYGIIYNVLSINGTCTNEFVLKKLLDIGYMPLKDERKEYYIPNLCNSVNVVKVYCYFYDKTVKKEVEEENFGCGKTMYFLMKKYQKTLKQVLDERKLSEKEILIILLQLFRCIQNLMDNNVLHCDIKLEDIMFDENNNVVLIDFGCGTDNSKSEIEGLTPPEIMKSKLNKDIVDWDVDCTKSDIFIVGLLIYQMIGLEFPLPSWTNCKKFPAFPSEKYPLLSKIVDGCLRTDPQERLNALHLIRLLENVLWIKKDNLSYRILKKGCMNMYNRLSTRVTEKDIALGTFYCVEERLITLFLIDEFNRLSNRNVKWNRNTFSLDLVIEKCINIGYEEIRVRQLCNFLANNGKYDQRLGHIFTELSEKKEFHTSKNLFEKDVVFIEEEEESNELDKKMLYLPNFLIIKQLGLIDKKIKKRGCYGMCASVYKVKFIPNGLFYALKVMMSYWMPDNEKSIDLRNNFLREFRVSKNLQKNRNIIKVYGHFYFKIVRKVFPSWSEGHIPQNEGGMGVNRTLAVVLDVYDLNLDEFILEKDYGRNEIFSVLIQLVSAVDALVQNNTIHSDIKPDNILIEKQLDGIKVVIIDFGLHFKVSDIKCADIEDKLKGGSTAYFSPELSINLKQIIADETSEKIFVDLSKSELWSIGVIGFKMLLKKYPFELIRKKNYETGEFKDDHIDILLDKVPEEYKEIGRILSFFLKRDLKDRFTVKKALKILQVAAFGPNELNDEHIKEWKMTMRFRKEKLCLDYLREYQNNEEDIMNEVKSYLKLEISENALKNRRNRIVEIISRIIANPETEVIIRKSLVKPIREFVKLTIFEQNDFTPMNSNKDKFIIAAIVKIVFKNNESLNSLNTFNLKEYIQSLFEEGVYCNLVDRSSVVLYCICDRMKIYSFKGLIIKQIKSLDLQRCVITAFDCENDFLNEIMKNPKIIFDHLLDISFNKVTVLNISSDFSFMGQTIKVTDDFFRIHRFIDNLKELTLCGLDQITGKNWIKMEKLVSLKIKECNNFQEIFFKEQKFDKLIILNVENCSLLSDTYVDNIVRQMSYKKENLKIRIECLNDIEEKSIEFLFRIKKSAKELKDLIKFIKHGLNIKGLVFKGQILRNERSVQSYSVKNGDVILLVKGKVIKDKRRNDRDFVVLKFGGGLADRVEYFGNLDEEQYGMYTDFDTLNNIGIHFFSNGNYRTALLYFEEAKKVSIEEGNKKGEAETLGNIGNVYFSLGEYRKSLIFHSDSLKICIEIGYKKGEASTLGNIGSVHYSLGEYQKSLLFHQNSLKMCLKLGDKKGESTTLGNIGSLFNAIGVPSKALLYCNKSLRIYKEMNDEVGEAKILRNIGSVYSSLGEYQKSLVFQMDSLKIQKMVGNRHGESKSLLSIGVIYGILGEYSKSLKFSEHSLKIQREITDKRGEAYSLLNIGIVYRLTTDYQKSLMFHRNSLKIQKEIGDKRGEAYSLLNIGIVYRLLGEYQKSLMFHQNSLKIQKEIGDKRGEAYSLLNIGIVYRLLGEYQKSLEFSNQSLKIRKEIGNIRGEAYSLLNIGIVYRLLEEYQKSLEFSTHSLKIQKKIGNIRGEAYSLLNIGRVYEAIGETKKGLKFYECSLKIFIEIGDKRGKGITLRDIAKLKRKDNKFFDSISLLNESKLLFEQCKLDVEVNKSEKLMNIYQVEKEEYIKLNIEKDIKNKRLSDFEIIKRVGQNSIGGFHGANSQIYLCRLKEHEILFALRVKFSYKIEGSTLSTPKVIEQSTNEFIPEKRLKRNPNILFNYSYFVDYIDRTKLRGFREITSEFVSDKTLFIVTAYMKGNLIEYIKKTGLIKEIVFLKFMKDILSGVCYLHRNYIVHRDLKSANILLTPDDRAVICDFGTHLDVIKQKSFFGNYGKNGTPFFLPPEILNSDDDEELDYSKTDIFSTGLIAYKLLTKSDEAFLNFDSRKDEEYREIQGNYSKEVKNLVRNMLRCKISERIDCYEALDTVSKMIEVIKNKPVIKWY